MSTRQPEDATKCALCGADLTSLSPTPGVHMVKIERPETPRVNRLHSAKNTLVKQDGSGFNEAEDIVPGSSRGSYFFFSLLIFLLFCTIAVLFFQLTGGDIFSRVRALLPAATSVESKAKIAPTQQKEVTAGVETGKKAAEEIRNSLIEKMKLPTRAPKGLGRVYLGTVVVQTPWGPVSGFLLDGKHVVTVRRGIEGSARKQEWALSNLATADKWVKAQQARLDFLVKKNDPAQVTARTRLQMGEKTAAQWRGIVQKIEKGLQVSDYVLVFADGSHRRAISIVEGKNYALSLFEFEGESMEFLQVGREQMAAQFKDENDFSESGLQKGARLLAVGGQRGSVLESIRGEWRNLYRGQSGRIYMKSAMNLPGSFHGGPLVDSATGSRVLGINYSCSQAGQGNWSCYAVPLGGVYEEFGLH
ncbi:hypothetical protein JWG39_00560 [Desulforhopalus vacuolatus]|uniref:hypothetical protein n=1 Tax=Desulforhopalus vacuolatus TaxID=40414 RepID=UPI001962B189|nr:hypothetical protein [Desulforhopalus vacuolatus]MBM9518306.1 hypothetical protein [Desulforhopalus vacuolatus]